MRPATVTLWCVEYRTFESRANVRRYVFKKIWAVTFREAQAIKHELEKAGASLIVLKPYYVPRARAVLVAWLNVHAPGEIIL
jgi:hypothetical protein